MSTRRYRLPALSSLKLPAESSAHPSSGAIPLSTKQSSSSGGFGGESHWQVRQRHTQSMASQPRPGHHHVLCTELISLSWPLCPNKMWASIRICLQLVIGAMLIQQSGRTLIFSPMQTNYLDLGKKTCSLSWLARYFAACLRIWSHSSSSSGREPAQR